MPVLSLSTLLAIGGSRVATGSLRTARQVSSLALCSELGYVPLTRVDDMFCMGPCSRNLVRDPRNHLFSGSHESLCTGIVISLFLSQGAAGLAKWFCSFLSPHCIRRERVLPIQGFDLWFGIPVGGDVL